MNSPYDTPFDKDFSLDAREHATIGDVRNFSLASHQHYHFNQEIRKTLVDLDRLLLSNPNATYGEVEEMLRKEYGTGEITEDGFRLSLALALPDTQIVRKTDTIITINQVPTNNMGSNVIDPFGWASRPVAPGENYGLFGKAPELRPNTTNEKFNPDLHNTIMNTRADIQGLVGFAIEIGGKDSNGKEETVVMPVFIMKGGMDLLKQFSHEKPENPIPTAKWILANK